MHALNTHAHTTHPHTVYTQPPKHQPGMRRCVPTHCTTQKLLLDLAGTWLTGTGCVTS